jgi:hypothetical protein
MTRAFDVRVIVLTADRDVRVIVVTDPVLTDAFYDAAGYQYGR